MVVGGSIISWLSCNIWVCGCIVRMWFSGGFLRAFSLVSNKEVHSGFRFCMRYSHVSMFGPMVVISANRIFGVG